MEHCGAGPRPGPVVPTVASGGTLDTFPGTLQAVQRSAGHSGDGGYTGHLARVMRSCYLRCLVQSYKVIMYNFMERQGGAEYLPHTSTQSRAWYWQLYLPR